MGFYKPKKEQEQSKTCKGDIIIDNRNTKNIIMTSLRDFTN